MNCQQCGSRTATIGNVVETYNTLEEKFEYSHNMLCDVCADTTVGNGAFYPLLTLQEIIQLREFVSDD